jgi:hypothetical protein
VSARLAARSLSFVVAPPAEEVLYYRASRHEFCTPIEGRLYHRALRRGICLLQQAVFRRHTAVYHALQHVFGLFIALYALREHSNH